MSWFSKSTVQFHFIFQGHNAITFSIKKKKERKKSQHCATDSHAIVRLSSLDLNRSFVSCYDKCIAFSVFASYLGMYLTKAIWSNIKKKENGGVVVSRYTFVTLHWQTVSTVLLMHCLPSSSVRPTGRSPRWGQQQRRQPPLSCHRTAAHPEPGGEGHAAESARRASGPSVESVTSARTWRSLEGRVAWSSHALWDSV